MTIAFVIFVFDLIAEFFAHTFVFGKFTHLARAIAVFVTQAFLNLFYDFLIFVKSDFHFIPLENISCDNLKITAKFLLSDFTPPLSFLNEAKKNIQKTAFKGNGHRLLAIAVVYLSRTTFS